MVHKFFVKICGLQTAESVQMAVDEGADAVGFVFAPGSVRLVTADRVRKLVQLVPEWVETVGVFRDQPIDEVLHTAQESGISTVQLHGDETFEDLLQVKSAGFRVLRALTIDSYLALTTSERQQLSTERVLIDAVEPGAGETFDSSEIITSPPKGWWLLAGGLTPDNVQTLIAKLQPAGVDVSSGVETGRGIKDSQKIASFIRNVRNIE